MYRSIFQPKTLFWVHFEGSVRVYPISPVKMPIENANGISCPVNGSICRRQQWHSYHSLRKFFHTQTPLRQRNLFPPDQNSFAKYKYQPRFCSSGGSTSKKRKKFDLMSKGNVKDPFLVLGIVRSPTLTYASVKRTFLQIAMKYHPDTSKQSSESDREKHKDLFVAARMAFEAIVAGPEGVAILKTEAADYVEEEEDFEEWFKAETGHDMPFMDAATMKEVADMTETVGGGLDRDGGMWTLARMVANTVKEGGDGRSVLQLEAGVIRDREINGILRRKRRR
jgi:hypothetical protein